MKKLRFPSQKMIIVKVEKQNSICINVFCYENGLTYLLYISSKKFSDCMDLLLIFDENKSHYVYIKDFNRLAFNKTKKSKKYFCRCCLQCFSSEKFLAEHRENRLVINSKENVKLEKCSVLKIILNNCLFLLKSMLLIFSVFYGQLCQKESKVVIKMSHTLKNIKIMFFAVLLIKLFVLTINLVKMLFFTEEKMLLTNLLKQFLKNMTIAKK